MTQEDKELLLKGLCARLPYGVKVEITVHNLDYNKDFGKIAIADIIGIHTVKDDDGNSYPCIITCYDTYKIQGNDIETVKPYLRPMSSMTEEEREAFQEYIFDSNEIGEIITLEASDWLNKKMFDYRGLIEKGLAIKVTKENNPYANN